MGAIESKIKKDLTESSTISWSKNNISPGTDFMNLLIEKLNSKKTLEKIAELNDKIKYVVSGTKEFGEGEKIIDYIDDNKIKSDITIFSPDADMILLSLILLNISSNVKILRRDQQESDKIYKITKDSNLSHFAYNIIDIDLMGKTLYGMLKKLTNVIDSNKAINDIVLIFTFFGDDFLPKLESYNVDNDVKILLDIYTKVYNELNEFLINENKINLKFLKKLINELAENENNILRRNYFMKSFHNYKSLQSKIEKETNITLSHDKFLQYNRMYNFYRLLNATTNIVLLIYR